MKLFSLLGQKYYLGVGKSNTAAWQLTRNYSFFSCIVEENFLICLFHWERTQKTLRKLTLITMVRNFKKKNSVSWNCYFARSQLLWKCVGENEVE